MLGTILLVAGCVVGFGSVAIGLLGVISGLFDTAGLSWFVLATWKDASLWDR